MKNLNTNIKKLAWSMRQSIRQFAEGRVTIHCRIETRKKLPGWFPEDHSGLK